jgi:hypothetical protein
VISVPVFLESLLRAVLTAINLNNQLSCGTIKVNNVVPYVFPEFSGKYFEAFIEREHFVYNPPLRKGDLLKVLSLKKVVLPFSKGESEGIFLSTGSLRLIVPAFAIMSYFSKALKFPSFQLIYGQRTYGNFG